MWKWLNHRRLCIKFLIISFFVCSFICKNLIFSLSVSKNFCWSFKLLILVSTNSDSECTLLLIVENSHFTRLFNADICASILFINCWCSSNEISLLFCGEGVLTFEIITGAILFVGESSGVTSCSSTVNGWGLMVFVPGSRLDWLLQLSLILQNVSCSKFLVSFSAIKRKESPYTDFLFSITFLLY